MNQEANNEIAGITVLVPTKKRHHYLRNCLQSIAAQSSTDLLRKVIVSENSDDSASEVVIASFSDMLPIQYIRQQPEIPVEEHCLSLFKHVSTSHVAIIADDDMWGRYHLEEAARAFHHHPEINTFFGQAIVVCNETCYPLRRFTGSLLQIPIAADRSIQEFTLLSTRDVAMHCMAHTPLNIFSIVAKTETLKQGLLESANAPQPSTDKMLIWKLACLGPIAVGREISLFYRAHANSMMTGMLDVNSMECYQSDYRLTREIEKQAQQLGYDPVSDWRDAYTKAQSLGISEHIHTWSPLVYRQLIRGEDPLTTQSRPTLAKPSLRQRLHNLLYLITPPLFSKVHIRSPKRK